MLKQTALAAALFAASTVQSAAESVTVAIANFGEHPQLSALSDGFKDELSTLGAANDLSVSFTEDHVNFDTTLLPQMLEKISAQNPNLVLTVTTPVSQVAKNLFSDSGVPLVFSAVTDPVSAELVPSWEAGAKNMSGASDALDIAATLAFARNLFPDAKTMGVPYNPAEANDLATLQLFKDNAAEHGFEIVEVGIDNVNDIQARITALGGRADIIYGPSSNLIQPAISAVAAAANEAGVPIINSDAGLVNDGVIAAGFSVSYDKIGRLAAQLAIQSLNGTQMSDIQPTRPSYDDHQPVISKSAMAAVGATIPESFNACGCIVD